MNNFPDEFLIRFNSRYSKSSGCWIWTSAKSGNGYGAITLRRKSMAAHRVSFIIHKGEIPDGLIVMHSCDVPLCVNPDHLSLGTHRDNAADMVAKGRHAHGELHYMTGNGHLRSGSRNAMFGLRGRSSPNYGRTGEKSPSSVVTDAQRVEIISLRDAGWTYVAIGKRFGLIPGSALGMYKSKKRLMNEGLL